MIRLMTTSLTLGISIATATTAIAQDGFFGNCNPNSTRCRLLSGSNPPAARSRRARQYLIAIATVEPPASDFKSE